MESPEQKNTFNSPALEEEKHLRIVFQQKV